MDILKSAVFQMPEAMPHRTTAHLIVEKEGGVLAPDSADPWPIDIWQNMDLDAAEKVLTTLKAQVDAADPVDRRKYTESSGFYFSPEERALLTKLGETSLSA